MSLFNKNQQIIDLQNQILELQKQVHPDFETIKNLQNQIATYSEKNKKQKEIYENNKKVINNLDKIIATKKEELKSLESEIIKTSEELTIQSYGLFVPTYKLMQSDKYKSDMTKIRDLEKKLIKENKATLSANNWIINGSDKEGNKLVKDITKLLLKSFNLECNEIIDKINAANYNQSIERIDKSAEQISKLGKAMSISISNDYVVCKKKECVIAFNYALAKEEERETLRRIKEEEKEKEKVRKEIEEQKKKMEKEETHYEKALKELQNEIEKNKEDKQKLEDLLNKQKELNESLQKVKDEKNSINFREAHIKAGYVYIISNIGSFGENIYKIGCTRRLEPMDRINELGDASVPFKFDVHALIFSEDAFALENALHKAFDDKKVNLENPKKEFFNVTLDEIKKVVNENFDKTVDFIDIPEAAQYRASLKMREMMKNGVRFEFDNTEDEEEG